MNGVTRWIIVFHSKYFLISAQYPWRYKYNPIQFVVPEEALRNTAWFVFIFGMRSIEFSLKKFKLRTICHY